MLRFKYTVTINALPAYGDKQRVENLTGTVEAENQSSAYERVKIFAWDRCQELKEQRGGIFGYENVRVELAPAVAPSSNASHKEPIIALINRYLEQAKQRKQRNAELVKETEVHQEQICASIEVIDAVGQIRILQQLLQEIQNGNAVIQKDV